jgi:hypothetical protein
MQKPATLALLGATVLLAAVAPDIAAQTLEERIQALETQVDRMATTGGLLFLYGVFCALWAQRTGRSAWVWFFLGLFFGPLTAVMLLYKNSRDKRS